MDVSGSFHLLLLLLLFIVLACPFTSSTQKNRSLNTVSPTSESSLTSTAPPPPPDHLDTTQSPSPSLSFPDSSFPDANVTGPGCLIDPQLSLVAAASAGGLLLGLLTSILVLACQVFRLQRRLRQAYRPSRSNADLLTGTGYWGTARLDLGARGGGVLGPCDSSTVMMEEVRAATARMEELEEVEEREESDAEGEEGGGGMTTDNRDRKETERLVPSSASRDSCQEELPADLENMPLVV